MLELGAAELGVEDVLADWRRPSYDIARSTIGVFVDARGEQRLAGYVDHAGGEVAYAAVNPDHQGRGVGTWLAG